MLYQLLAINKIRSIKIESFENRWLIVVICAIVFTLEFSTPPAYVFGYFYIGTIVLASSRVSRTLTLEVTLLGCGFTLLNLLVPGIEPITPPVIANRFIVVLALMVTAWLSDRNRRNEEAIAKQKAQLQAQEKLARLREDFVSTLTHDLKTPLLGAIETLKSFQQEQFGPIVPAQKKVLEMMDRSHRTTLQLVETMLDVYRNDSEGLQLNLAPVNLVTIAEEAIATLTPLAANRRVYILLKYGETDFPRSLWVRADALQLQRVFTNLLMNSINHSPRGGCVEVILELKSTYQTVKVLDLGPGITPDEFPYLFTRFYQGHSNRHAKGSGLGLYLTRQIVEAHGGIIGAENRSPSGAKFFFKLPAGQPLANSNPLPPT